MPSLTLAVFDSTVALALLQRGADFLERRHPALDAGLGYSPSIGLKAKPRVTHGATMLEEVCSRKSVWPLPLKGRLGERQTLIYGDGMEQTISLLTAFGLGSIVTALVQTWLSRRYTLDERNFQERKSAYIGLLEAYHQAAVKGTDEAAKSFALWQMRCELVAPAPVRNAISQIVATNEDRNGRNIAHENLKIAMRADLKVTK